MQTNYWYILRKKYLNSLLLLKRPTLAVLVKFGGRDFPYSPPPKKNNCFTTLITRNDVVNIELLLVTSVTRRWSKKVSISCKIISMALKQKSIFFKIAKSHQSFWSTFVSKFVDKNFQKLPNQVTLLVTKLNQNS